MSRIYWDTMLFVYMIEDHPVYAPKVDRIYRRMQERGDTLFTSSLAFGESLTGALKSGDTVLTQDIRRLFGSNEVKMLPFLPSTAEVYASIRARESIPQPDAIHLAMAAEAGIDIFFTNDKQLHGRTIPGIHFIVGLEGKLF
ncbi:MAG TPA: PIN domain-containing protein [Alloacidobacterium sp.]|nr:PIN domain-containing protein [Alloacidobacterium sp.]